MIVDARDGAEYLDFFSYFATNPVGHNHPKINKPEFKRFMGEVAIHNPSLSDFYNTVMADFVDTFRRLAQPAGVCPTCSGSPAGRWGGERPQGRLRLEGAQEPGQGYAADVGTRSSTSAARSTGGPATRCR